MKRILESILNCIARLWLGFLLIILCSGTLLYINRPKNNNSSSRKPEVAILTISSRTVMEDFLKGCRDLFFEHGYEDGKNIDFHFYNPQGDLPTANMMADDIIQRNPALVITASTPMLQIMANRNRSGIVRHIFGLVTDPFSAIEDLDRNNPEQHPAHIGGYGSFQPVERLFDQMLILQPGLKKVGTIRNAGEACSEATFNKAKDYCKAKGIELIDFTVESPAAVQEAVKAVIDSDVEAIWIGGDNTVEAAIELVVNEADKAGLPVFTHSPTHLKFGTAISLGADYYEVGRITAKLAVDVLEGKTTLKNQKVENKVPELLAINEAKLKNFTTRPAALAKLIKSASLIVDAQGKVVNKVKTTKKPVRSKRLAKIHMIAYNYSIPCENAEEGFLEGLTEAGFKEGRDFKLKRANGAGDMATLSLLVDAAVSDNTNLIACFSTPALQTVVARARNIPAVYSFVASGVIAGAGESATKHKKNITGVDVLSPVDETLLLLKKYFPEIKKIGFIFTSGSSSSEYYVTLMTESAKKHGFELVQRSCGSSMEASESFLAVLQENVDAIVQIPDNNVYAAFENLVMQCEKTKVPLFCNSSAFVKKGACLALATDYRACGKQSAKLAARILHGEKPANIPFEKPDKKVLYINKKAFAKLALKLPEELLEKADKIF
jgi:ABC-type uncharacterized transport system substrate-binding protein